MLRTSFLALIFALLVLVLPSRPAFASDASDAHKQASALKKAVESAKGDDEKKDAQSKLEAFCRDKSAALQGKDKSPLDLAYIGLIQSMGGMYDEAIATLRSAVNDKRENKYLPNIHGYLVDTMIDAGKPMEAFAELEKMAVLHTGSKPLKTVSMNVGMALRGTMNFPESAKALEMALAERNAAAIKPLVNSYLMANDKEGAIKAVETAIEKADDKQKPELEVLLATTKAIGHKLAFAPVAIVPAPAPEIAGKVKVLGVWNPDAGTMRWTLALLDAVRNRYASQPVVALGVSTYYKKDAASGKMDENMTPEAEHDQGVKIRDQWEYKCELAFVKTEAELDALGRTALPYFVVLDKDDTLLFAHVMNRSDRADVDILYKVIEKAIQ